MAGSPLIPVGPRVGIRVENGSGSLDYFFFLLRGSMYVCVDTPACIFKQATSRPLGSLGLGVCTPVAFSALWKMLPGVHKLHKRPGVMWAGSSELLQGLGAWSRSGALTMHLLGKTLWAMDSSTQEEKEDPSRGGTEWGSKSQSRQD